MKIYTIDASPGAVGMSGIPGRVGDYGKDISAIADWGAGLVLSMTPLHDLDKARGDGRSLAQALAEHNIAWHHLPIADFGAPPPSVEALWPDAAAAAHRVLDAGGRVLTHCFGGCGRSGMAALRLLVERGEDPEAALARMRTVRACAVETQGQFLWASQGAA